jgi:hypothetical protein
MVSVFLYRIRMMNNLGHIGYSILCFTMKYENCMNMLDNLSGTFARTQSNLSWKVTVVKTFRIWYKLNPVLIALWNRLLTNIKTILHHTQSHIVIVQWIA